MYNPAEYYLHFTNQTYYIDEVTCSGNTMYMHVVRVYDVCINFIPPFVEQYT